MNRILKGLLVTALAVSATQVSAYTNKTFLMPRPVGVDLPMEMTTFHELVEHKGHDRFGGTFAVTGFGKGTSSDGMGRYFLFNNKDTVTLSEGLNGDGAGHPAVATTSDLDLRYLIHDFAGTNNAAVQPGFPFPVTVGLSPEQTAYGVRFDYHQCLGKILKGLYFYANLPVAHVQNDLKLNIGGTPVNYTPGVVVAGPTTPSVQTTLANYFAGTFSNPSTAAGVPANSQVALTNAKIAGKRSETGVADIDLGLGYKFLHKERYHAALAIAVTIPTGDEADGAYLFDAIVGNGDHFALGGDLCAGARIWGDCDHNLKLNLSMKYRYLFESTEKRTLGIKGRNFGQYLLLVPAATTLPVSFVPAANVTTLNVDVTPGSQFDGILGFTYNNGGFTFDLGYNLYFREEEDVKLKGAFTDGSYAIANVTANATTLATRDAAGVAVPAAPPIAGGATPTPLVVATYIDGATVAAQTANILTKATLDLDAASTPSQLTNGIYTGIGYSFKEWDTPLMLGLGGKYEWASKNSAFDQWTVYGKIGIGF